MSFHCIKCWNLHNNKICANCGYEIISVKELEQKIKKYEDALKKIASQDYRGSRPYEQVIAYEALKNDY